MAGGAIKGEAWSPAGGWNFIPKNWKPNTVFVLAGLAGVAAVSWAVGSRLQYQSNTEKDDEIVERWNSAARKARQQSAISQTHGSS